MAVHSVSLFNSPQLAAIAGGVEFYVTDCANLSPTLDGEPTSLFRARTALVSIAGSDADRFAFRPLLTALSFGQTASGVCAGPEWLAKLPERLSSRSSLLGLDCVTAVLHIGSESTLAVETVQTAVDRLNDCFGEKLVALVIVTANSHHFARVRNVTGFVTGASVDIAWIARTLFLSLAMFAAPQTLNGLDLNFLLPFLGTSGEPAVLIETLWFRGRPGQLIFPSKAGQEVFRRSNGGAAIPLPTSTWGWGELGRLMKAIRRNSPQSASFLTFAANNAITPSVLSDRVFAVPCILLR